MLVHHRATYTILSIPEKGFSAAILEYRK